MHAGTAESQLPQYKRVPRLLLMKTDTKGYIAPSVVAQKHICIRHDGAYTVERALELFKTTEELGFGKVIEIETPVNRRRVKRFSKTTYDNLPPPAKRILQEFKITERAYVTGFGKTLRMGFFVKTEFDASLISSTLELTHLQV